MRKKYIREAFAHYLIALIALVFGIIFIVLANHMGRAQRSKLNEQQAQISELTNSITITQRTQQQAEEKAISVVTGLDTARTNRDTAKIEDFLSKVMSWKSWDEYNDVRTMLIEDYGVAADSSILTEFMPKVPNEVSNDGKTNYNDIDTNGLRVSYDSVDVYLTDTIGMKCYYTAFVKWHTSDEKGRTSSSDTIFTLSVDDDGNISDLYAFA